MLFFWYFQNAEQGPWSKPVTKVFQTKNRFLWALAVSGNRLQLWGPTANGKGDSQAWLGRCYSEMLPTPSVWDVFFIWSKFHQVFCCLAITSPLDSLGCSQHFVQVKGLDNIQLIRCPENLQWIRSVRNCMLKF